MSKNKPLISLPRLLFGSLSHLSKWELSSSVTEAKNLVLFLIPAFLLHPACSGWQQILSAASSKDMQSLTVSY